VATPPHTATEHEIRERTATDERQATTFPKVIISAAVEQPRGRSSQKLSTVHRDAINSEISSGIFY